MTTIPPSAAPSPSPSGSTSRDAVRSACPRENPRPSPLRSGDERRRGDAFERLLREKSGGSDDAPEDTETCASPSPPDAAACLFGVPAASPFAAKLQVLRSTCAGSLPPDSSATAAKAALGAALGGLPGAAAPETLRQQVAGSWQVSMNDPRGVPLELRAQRSDAPGAPSWALGIGSGVADAALLARHVPRLNERLLARGIGATHVRIEDEPDDPQGQR